MASWTRAPASEHLLESSLGALLCSRPDCTFLFAELSTEKCPQPPPHPQLPLPRNETEMWQGPHSWAHRLISLPHPLPSTPPPSSLNSPLHPTPTLPRKSS